MVTVRQLVYEIRVMPAKHLLVRHSPMIVVVNARSAYLEMLLTSW